MTRSSAEQQSDEAIQLFDKLRAPSPVERLDRFVAPLLAMTNCTTNQGHNAIDPDQKQFLV
jgi:hypothetical protein